VEFISKNETETHNIAEEFAAKIKLEQDRATVVGLYGELGAGKTTFMKGVAKSFGINETIQSPTFVIEKIYELSNLEPRTSIFDHLIHIDAYRIDKSDELINLGWKEIISDPKNIIFIEWPERIEEIMPEHAKIKFEHINESQRKITFE
jgi:tRNA threonylcarbamoyladenosine biosynthesis protein TsaE